MRHSEGGWPKDVDFTEQSDMNRFRKKAEKDDDYRGAVKALGPVVARCMRQNNTIDIYEEYFVGSNVDHSSEPPSAKGLAVFRDPNDIKRTATSINWHPDPAAPAKLAVSYSILTFQDPNYAGQRVPQQSYGTSSARRGIHREKASSLFLLHTFLQHPFLTSLLTQPHPFFEISQFGIY